MSMSVQALSSIPLLTGGSGHCSIWALVWGSQCCSGPTSSRWQHSRSQACLKLKYVYGIHESWSPFRLDKRNVTITLEEQLGEGSKKSGCRNWKHTIGRQMDRNLQWQWRWASERWREHREGHGYRNQEQITHYIKTGSGKLMLFIRLICVKTTYPSLSVTSPRWWRVST